MLEVQKVPLGGQDQGIDTMHKVSKGQLACPAGQALSAADQFYSLTF
jgi:hypothetical protein